MATETNNQTEEITDIALIEQDKSTVDILREDDLATLKEALNKVRNFKRKYSLKKLQVTDISNTEQKENLRLALADMRTTRTALTKDKTEKTKPYRQTVSYINENYDKAIEAIEAVEEPLQLHHKEIKKKIEDLEKEEELRKELQLKNRIAALIDAGITIHEGFYQIGSEEFNVPFTTLGIVDIQPMTDSVFESVLNQVIEKNAIITNQKKIAELLKKEQEEERLKKEAEDKKKFLEEQEKLKSEQEALKKEREEMEKWRKEMQAEKDRIAKEKAAEEKKQKEIVENQRLEKLRSRRNSLTDLGLTLNSSNWYVKSYKNINAQCGLSTMENSSDEEFDFVVNNIKAVLKEQVAMKEQDDELARKVIAEKALADQKKKEEELAKQKVEELAKAGDKAVWDDFIQRLRAVHIPTMTSKVYKEKIGVVMDFLADLNQ